MNSQLLLAISLNPTSNRQDEGRGLRAMATLSINRANKEQTLRLPYLSTVCTSLSSTGSARDGETVPLFSSLLQIIDYY